MSDLPVGWTSTLLDELCTDVSYGYTAKANAESGDAKMLRITDIQDNNVNWSTVPYCRIDAETKVQYALKRGDLVFARTGATVGKSFLIADDIKDAVFASYLIRVRPAIHDLSRYLAFFFGSQTYWTQITDFSAGIGQPNVNGTKLKQLEIPLAPLSEQQRIADKVDSLLSRVDACRERLDRVPAILKRFRQSVLAAATSGKLTEDWREENSNLGDVKAELENVLRSRQENWNRYIKTKYKTPVGPDLASTLKAPAEWAEISLDAITSIITSGSRAWTKYYGSGTGTFIMAQNVRPGRLDLSVRQAVNPPEGDRDAVRSQVQIGDLLVTIVGANTGDVCPVQTELPEHYVCQSVALMRPVEIQHSDYLNLYLNAESHGKGEFARYMYGEGRPHLSFDQLRMTKVLLPPIAEQAEIVRRVHDLFSFANNIDMQLQNVCKRVSRLTPSLLAKAFRGQLVSQDPNDEPASALLERIRAAKSNIKAKTSRRKPKSKAT